MAQWHISSLLSRTVQNKYHHALRVTIPTEHILSLRQTTISVDDPDFLAGYEEGTNQYCQWHRDDLTIDAGLLLSLVRNGWGGSQYSAMWQTGYIIGWLFTLFASANERGAV